MAPELASIGDGAINAASAIDASASLVSGLGLGTRGFNDALTAMTKPMENTPSIKDFLLKCPFSLFNA